MQVAGWASKRQDSEKHYNFTILASACRCKP